MLHFGNYTIRFARCRNGTAGQKPRQSRGLMERDWCRGHPDFRATPERCPECGAPAARQWPYRRGCFSNPVGAQNRVAKATPPVRCYTQHRATHRIQTHPGRLGNRLRPDHRPLAPQPLAIRPPVSPTHAAGADAVFSAKPQRNLDFIGRWQPRLRLVGLARRCAASAEGMDTHRAHPAHGIQKPLPTPRHLARQPVPHHVDVIAGFALPAHIGRLLAPLAGLASPTIKAKTQRGDEPVPELRIRSACVATAMSGMWDGGGKRLISS